jgi:hypothetical protein
VPRDFSSLLEGDQRRKLKAPYFALRDFILAIMVATRCAEHVMPFPRDGWSIHPKMD